MIKKIGRPRREHKNLLIKIGQNLRETRLQKGVSVKQLSVKSGIGCSHLYKIEKGEVNIRICNLLRLAVALGVDASELLPPYP